MENQKNMIETALAAAQKPFYEFTPNGMPVFFTPVGEGKWEVNTDTSLLEKPLRKKGAFILHDTASLIKFVQKHKEEGTQVFIDADFKTGRISVRAVIDGHTAAEAGWCGFHANYNPMLTPAASRWLDSSGEKMNQGALPIF